MGGRVSVTCSHFHSCDKSEKGNLVENREQAKAIKVISGEFIAGLFRHRGNADEDGRKVPQAERSMEPDNVRSDSDEQEGEKCITCWKWRLGSKKPFLHPSFPFLFSLSVNQGMMTENKVAQALSVSDVPLRFYEKTVSHEEGTFFCSFLFSASTNLFGSSASTSSQDRQTQTNFFFQSERINAGTYR